MRLLILLVCMLSMTKVYAQNDYDYIAPEGKILNYRTLVWDDFQGKEDKEFSDKLAERNLQALAYVCPAIYVYPDSAELLANGRVKAYFRVKCAFQSRAFFRESTKQDRTKSVYVLTHEQDHYDIALNYANILQATLSSRDYDANKYEQEIIKIYHEILQRHDKVQETYDGEVNPEGRDDLEKQHLWDMRIKKCLENGTEEYYSSPESAVQNVKVYGAQVKRIPGEPALQFVVRARPLYTEFPQEMTPKIRETSEWTQEPAIIAFYTQRYIAEEDESTQKDSYRTLAYMFVPKGNNIYKRILIDTFCNAGQPVKIAATFFANADSDQVKELVIVATSNQKDKQASGTLYMNRVYDNVTRLLPGRLTKLADVSAKIDGGFDGVKDGKAVKAKYKNEKEITDALKKLGYN